tara:strand:+ start:485 stop:694 length:210 start_codon:yes stop_codon:yes gene_type:complete
MWFEDIEQLQFTHFALQDARLDTTYWLGVLIAHLDDTSEQCPRTDQEIVSLKNKIARLINSVEKDIACL